MSDSFFAENAVLRTTLTTALSLQSNLPADGPAACGGIIAGSGGTNIVVTMNEVNDRHGTGPLVKRIMEGRPNVLSIRSRDDWGAQDFGAENIKLSHQGLSRPDSFQRVILALAGRKVNSILCVPYLADELTTAIVLKEAFGAPLCAYVMDDQNVATNRITDDLMREFLEKCSVRFATHPELCDAYERKFGVSFYVLPAVVPSRLVSAQPAEFVPPPGETRFALLGSIWDQAWFDRLCDVLARCGVKVDWFGNNKSPWLSFPASKLRQAGIVPRGIVPETQLAEELQSYPFVIVPMSMLNNTDSNRGVAALSLPGRILFAAATAHTPSLILGSPETCGSRFVRHFGIGETAPYHPAKVAAAIAKLCDADRQRQYRKNAAVIGASFSDRGVADWLASSIEKGEPADSRFEDAFSGYRQGEQPAKKR